MMKSTLVCLICALALVTVTNAQFLYPADANPPTFRTTLECFQCEGEGCDTPQRISEDLNNTDTCTLIRPGCWILQNQVTKQYTRSCTQPSSIRQGVFCNRHIEGREFCYAYDDGENGRVRICAKCCLNNRCNNGLLTGESDPELTTCVACDGTRDEMCNQEQLISTLNNSTYTEQCLFPNADCWKERRVRNGNEIYQRGCQLLECNQENRAETCTFDENRNEQTCINCCENQLCNRLQFETRSSNNAASLRNYYVIATLFMIISYFLLF